MNVRVVLFAVAKELTGVQSMVVTLDDDATVGDLKTQLAIQHPVLSKVLQHCTMSVDRQYANDEKRLYHGCEVGCIPPVSGG